MYAVVRSTNSRAVLGSYYSQENETGNETSYAAAVPRSYYVCNWVGRTLTLCVTCLTSFTPFLSHYLSLLSLSSWLISQGTWLLTVQPIIYVRNVEPRLLLFSLGMLWGVVFYTTPFCSTVDSVPMQAFESVGISGSGKASVRSCDHACTFARMRNYVRQRMRATFYALYLLHAGEPQR